MNKVSISFIGGGRITRIMLQAFKNKHIDFTNVVICDINPEILSDLKHQFPEIKTTDSISIAASRDIVFLALHPPVIMDIIGQISNCVSAETIFVSLAPKISIKQFSEALIHSKKIVRLIPNATSIHNLGFNPICFSDEVPETDKKEISELLAYMGQTFEVEESKLESYAILSAMLPTYFWFQMEELIRIGIQIGLTEAESRKSVKETLLAATMTFFDSGLKPDEVRDLIPVKPIGEYEDQIIKFYQEKLIPLHGKIKSC